MWALQPRGSSIPSHVARQAMEPLITLAATLLAIHLSNPDFTKFPEETKQGRAMFAQKWCEGFLAALKQEAASGQHWLAGELQAHVAAPAAMVRDGVNAAQGAMPFMPLASAAGAAGGAQSLQLLRMASTPLLSMLQQQLGPDGAPKAGSPLAETVRLVSSLASDIAASVSHAADEAAVRKTVESLVGWCLSNQRAAPGAMAAKPAPRDKLVPAVAALVLSAAQAHVRCVCGALQAAAAGVNGGATGAHSVQQWQLLVRLRDAHVRCLLAIRQKLSVPQVARTSADTSLPACLVASCAMALQADKGSSLLQPATSAGMAGMAPSACTAACGALAFTAAACCRGLLALPEACVLLSMLPADRPQLSHAAKLVLLGPSLTTVPFNYQPPSSMRTAVPASAAGAATFPVLDGAEAHMLQLLQAHCVPADLMLHLTQDLLFASVSQGPAGLGAPTATAARSRSQGAGSMASEAGSSENASMQPLILYAPLQLNLLSDPVRLLKDLCSSKAIAAAAAASGEVAGSTGAGSSVGTGGSMSSAQGSGVAGVRLPALALILTLCSGASGASNAAPPVTSQSVARAKELGEYEYDRWVGRAARVMRPVCHVSHVSVTCAIEFLNVLVFGSVVLCCF